MARIYINCGEYDKAIDEFDYMLAAKGSLVVNDVKFIPWAEPLRERPRFKAMIAKYRNSSRGI